MITVSCDKCRCVQVYDSLKEVAENDMFIYYNHTGMLLCRDCFEYYKRRNELRKERRLKNG